MIIDKVYNAAVNSHKRNFGIGKRYAVLRGVDFNFRLFAGSVRLFIRSNLHIKAFYRRIYAESCNAEISFRFPQVRRSEVFRRLCGSKRV